jgi:DNA-binding MarR family transcriptional regulator
MNISVKQSKKKDSVKVDHALLMECASNRELTKKSYRVLLYLFTIADSRSFSKISQKQIAEDIDMDRASVSLALKSLNEEGIIKLLPYSQGIIFNDFEDEDEEEYE